MTGAPPALDPSGVPELEEEEPRGFGSLGDELELEVDVEDELGPRELPPELPPLEELELEDDGLELDEELELDDELDGAPELDELEDDESSWAASTLLAWPSM